MSSRNKQLVDARGKVRALNCPEGVIYTAPIAPMFIKGINLDELTKNTIEQANDLITRYGLEIVGISPNQQGFDGYWVKSNAIPYGFIPLSEVHSKPSNVYEEMVYTTNTNDNPYKKYSEIKRWAYFIKQHALYALSKNYELYNSDPQAFVKKVFVINTKIQSPTEYNIGFDINDKNFYNKKGKLMLSSKVLFRRIMRFLSISIMNDEPRVLNFSSRTYIEVHNKPDELRSSDNNLIFTSETSLKNWNLSKQTKDLRYNIYNVLQNTKSPYFFYSLQIMNGTPFLIQNVYNGYKELAIVVSKDWKESKINSGYYAGRLGFSFLVWKGDVEKVRSMAENERFVGKTGLNSGLLAAIVSDNKEMVILLLNLGATNLTQAAAYSNAMSAFRTEIKTLFINRNISYDITTDAIKHEVESLKNDLKSYEVVANIHSKKKFKTDRSEDSIDLLSINKKNFAAMMIL